MTDRHSDTRYISLDFLRGVAAIGVVVFHCLKAQWPALRALFLLVDFFFVLSGFVLASTFPKSHQDSTQTRKFISKRALRFWPMTISVLIFQLAFDFAHFIHRGSFDNTYIQSNGVWSLVAASLLVQIVFSASLAWDGPLWSLSAEWFTNLACIPIVKNGSTKFLLGGTVAGAVLLGFGLKIDANWIAQNGPIRGFEAFGRAVYGFLIGVLIRKYYEKLRQLKFFDSPVPCFLGLIGIYIFALHYDYMSLYIAPLVFAVTIIYFTNRNNWIKSSSFAKPAAMLGALSFGIYVWHLKIYPTFQALGKSYFTDSATGHILIFLLVIFASIFMTVLTQRFVEKPLQKYFKNQALKRAALLLESN